MQSLKVEVTETERIAIGNELEKLFALHDRPLPNAKKVIVVNELADSGLPVRAITAGIRSLAEEDLKAIKLSTLLEAARDHVSGIDIRVACEDCDGRGTIVMRDAERRVYALACRCQNGAIFRNGQNLTTWEGGETQYSNGRELWLY